MRGQPPPSGAVLRLLEVDQDPLGKPGRRISLEDTREVWARDLENGAKAAGLFNRGEMTVTVKWADLGINGNQTVRDLWRQKDLGQYKDEFKTTIPRHGVVLLRITGS
ncbi:MAG: hypothetical protein ACLQVW_22240 [Limisphaerales bacterium]